ncbi:MAG: 2'-deoxycytidine 5'-triphosphate deaminase, partial [Rhodospirillaceae bacterium]|nr:2'-deoxycytidine 5'-triphosphate deaminase [Rhodospirillaceae bacterium]
MNEQSAQIATAAVETGHATGVLPSQSIRELIEQGNIRAENAIEDAQIQPASLDLRLGTVAHRVQASFLPGEGATVQDKIAQFGLHALDITDGAVLETGCVYIVPLQESLDLESRLAASANPKSSTRRLDIFTRLITDNGVEFDRVRCVYK